IESGEIHAIQILSAICHGMPANRESRNMVIGNQFLYVGHAQKNGGRVVVWNVQEQWPSRSPELSHLPESVPSMQLLFVIEWIQRTACCQILQLVPPQVRHPARQIRNSFKQSLLPRSLNRLRTFFSEFTDIPEAKPQNNFFILLFEAAVPSGTQNIDRLYL